MEYYFYILLVLIILAFYTDVTSNTIPNYLTIGGVVIGLLYHLLFLGVIGFLYSFLGMAVGLILLGVLYIFKAIGAGDVKLFAAIGAITGTEFVLHTSMYAILYAGVIGVMILLYKSMKGKSGYPFAGFYNWFIHLFIFKRIQMEKDNASKKYRFPFMYAVVPGIITAYYYVVML